MITATEFRKHLFQTLDRAAHGESVEISYRGRTFRLVPEQVQSKLARLPKRDTLNCSPDQIEEARKNINKELLAEWDRKWN